LFGPDNLPDLLRWVNERTPRPGASPPHRADRV